MASDETFTISGWFDADRGIDNRGEDDITDEVFRRLLAQLAGQMRANSQRWFPQIHDGSVDLDVFYALGLAGEAGEVANVTKKIMRRQSNTVDLVAGLAMEMADVFTYLLLLADHLGVDLLAEYHRKAEFNEERFGAVSH